MPFSFPLRSARRGLLHGAWAAALLAALGACAFGTDGAERVVASNDLVSLVVGGVREQRTLRLDPSPGAQINALFPPFVEFSPTERVQLTSPQLSADSNYFAASASASLAGVRGKRGQLKASVCPAAMRLCKFVELPVVLP